MKFLSNPLLWFLLAITLFVIGSGAVGFVGPDEPRYADVARAMLHSGDYVTPRLYGSPWFEKPPLYYWMAALFFRMAENEFTARLPSALAACALIGVFFWFSRRLFGKRVAMLAVLVLGSTVGWIGFAHAAVMDMLLAATLDAALAFLALWFWEKQEIYLYTFYALAGLATLAKGPVAVALAGLIALAYILTFREWRALRDILFSPGLVLFAVVAAPWYLLCYARNGYPFIQEFLLKHNIERYTSTALGHPQSLWFYFPVLAAGLFPWTPLLLLPLIEVFRSGARAILANRQKVFLLYWVVLPFVFFSFSQNKLPSYILPVLPPLALWIARIVEGGGLEVIKKEEIKKEKTKEKASSESATESGQVSIDDSLLQRCALWLIGLSSLLILSLPVFASLLLNSLTMGLRHAIEGMNAARLWAGLWKGQVPPPAMLVLLLPAGLSFYLLWRRDLLEASLAVVLGVGLSMLGTVAYLTPEVNRVASVRAVSQRMQVLGINADSLAVYNLPRSQFYGLSFYMGRALPEWTPQGAPASIAYVIANSDGILPDARSRIFFPGPHLRLWTLPASEFEIEIVPQPRKVP